MFYGWGVIFIIDKMEVWFESKDNFFIFVLNICNGCFRFYMFVFYKDKMI